MAGSAAAQSRTERFTPTLAGHIDILRIDHWFKNVFVLPGIIVGLSVGGMRWSALLHGELRTITLRIIGGMLATCLVASSNYVINEIMDASFDVLHPVKQRRPIPSGRASVPIAYAEWLAVGAAGLLLAYLISRPFLISMLLLWIMGCVYNIPPLRSKDMPYLDVLSEAVNNPIRLMAGWFMVSAPSMPPLSLLLSYWMVGCYLMALKRFAEYRDFKSRSQVAAYRPSLAAVSDQGLLISASFYGSAAMLFFGAFTMRYHFELILAYPLVAVVMAAYFSLAFRENSAVQHPEHLYREPRIMVAVVSCSVLMIVLLFADLPRVRNAFNPTAMIDGRVSSQTKGK